MNIGASTSRGFPGYDTKPVKPPLSKAKRPPPTETTNLQGITTDLLLEFLEIAIHSILYHREIYPCGFFERQQKYQIPIWVAAHPVIRSYVDNCIRGIQPALNENKIEAVMLAILEPNQRTPVERFAFRIIPDDFLPNNEETPAMRERKRYFRIGEALKGFSLRIAACKSYLKPLPPDCTCVLQIVTDCKTQVKMANDEHGKMFPWVEADDRERLVEGSRMQSIRGSTAGVCPMEMYVEETGNKFSHVFQNTEQDIEDEDV